MTPEVMILDLSETPYMDSAGFGLIMNSYVSRRIREKAAAGRCE